MAAKEMYDYLPTIAPDNDWTLNIVPSDIIPEEGEKSQEIHVGDDVSEERIDFGEADESAYNLELQFKHLSEADSGTLVESWNSSSIGNGCTKTFKWAHPTDTHTYVIRWNCNLRRTIKRASRHSIPRGRIRVVGKIADA